MLLLTYLYDNHTYLHMRWYNILTIEGLRVPNLTVTPSPSPSSLAVPFFFHSMDNKVIAIAPSVVSMSRLMVLGMLPLAALAASGGGKGSNALTGATKVRTYVRQNDGRCPYGDHSAKMFPH